MIPRYSLPEMAAVFTDAARLARWLEVELAVVDALASSGAIPPGDAAVCRERAPAVDEAFVAAVEAREQVTDHDVAAFVDVVQEAIGGPAAGWVHFGLTSSDVVDSALGMALVQAADLLLPACDRLIAALRRGALEHATTPMAGRTHGMHAEPTTFGASLALWCLQADRDRRRLSAARDAIAVGKLSGAVGTYSNIDPDVESAALGALGLTPVPATQVVARDRHAEYLYACASMGATVEMIATNIRHLARTEVGEVTEAFAPGQKGSSAMPHKRNPILSERLCGIARILRSYVGPGLEDVALWHERDISHSSVERVILPDANLAAYYVLVKAADLVERLEVHADVMRANLERSHGVVFSQSVLLALVRSGMARESAYRIVQAAAHRSHEEGRAMRDVLAADGDVTARMTDAELDEAFDLDRLVRNAKRTIDALEEVEA